MHNLGHSNTNLILFNRKWRASQRNHPCRLQRFGLIHLLWLFNSQQSIKSVRINEFRKLFLLLISAREDCFGIRINRQPCSIRQGPYLLIEDCDLSTIFAAASQRFVKKEVLGRGAYGVVYRGEDALTSQSVAIKYIQCLDGLLSSDKLRELGSLKRVSDCSLVLRYVFCSHQSYTALT